MIGLRLEIGYGGAQPLLYNPAAQFSPAFLGAWYDPSDYATLTQDSAGATPVTAAAQPVGRMLDKSGRGNAMSQATAAARSLTGTAGAIQFLTFDGVDDAIFTGTIALTADMDCFVAVRRNSATVGIILASSAADSTRYLGLIRNTADTWYAAAGTPTIAVNGVDVAGGTATSCAQLLAVSPLSTWLILEMKNVNMSTWPGFSISGYPSFPVSIDIGGIILAPAGDATTRTNNRKFLGNKVGLTL